MRVSFLKTFFEKLENLSDFKKIGIKLLFLPVYFWYLVLMNTVSLYLTVPILFHIIFRPKLKFTLWCISILFIFSFKMPWQITSEYGKNNIFLFLQSVHGIDYLQAFFLSIAAVLIFVTISYFLMQLVSRIIKKNNYLTLPILVTIFSAIQMLMYQFGKDYAKLNTYQILLLLVVALFSHKIWILFVGAQHYAYSNSEISVKNFFPNYLGYMSATREFFDLEKYYDNSLYVFFKGILSCLVIIGFYSLITKDPGPQLFFNTEVMCPSQISTKLFLTKHGTVANAWFCLFRTEFIFSILNHLVINFLHYLIPGFILGLNFTSPVGNPLKYRSFGGFLKSISYYYSLTLTRFFINEYYKLFKKFANGRHIAFMSLFFGVFTGGFIFHNSRDINYIFYFKELFYQAQLRQPLIYFTALALLCALPLHRKIGDYSKSPVYGVFLFILFLIAFSIIRFFNGFYMSSEFNIQIDYIKLLFGSSS